MTGVQTCALPIWNSDTVFSVKSTSYELMTSSCFDDVTEVRDDSQTSPGDSPYEPNRSPDVHIDTHDVANGSLDVPKITPPVPSSTNPVGPSKSVRISTFSALSLN